jgi:putative MFS transporter
MSGEAPVQPTPTASGDEAAVGNVLDTIKTFRHRWWAPALLGVIMLFDSWDSIAIAYAMPTLSTEWQLNPLTMGYIISAGYGGQFVGAASLGAIAERVGRLPVFIVASVIMCLLALGCAFAHDYTTLLLLRFVQGVMIGGAMPVAITYVNELAPTKIRGRYFGLFQTLAISGFAVAAQSSPFVITHLGWRWMFGLGFIPIFLIPLVWLTLPESPRWLARLGRREAASKALLKLGGTPAAFTGEASVVSAKTPQPSMLTLFSREFIGRTLVITALWFLTMFAAFGMTTWIPTIYAKIYHFPVGQALSYSAIGSTVIFIALVCSGFLIDKFGRRPFSVGGLAVTATMLLSLAVLRPTQAEIIVTMVILAHLGSFFGSFVVWPYTAETFPTNVRALALGYGSSIGRGASMLMPIFVGYVLNQNAPVEIVFAMFGLCALVGFLCWVFLTRETRGKPLDAI